MDIENVGVFIAGWKQKDFPHLHNLFHIGDQLISVNDHNVCSATQTFDLIRQSPSTLEVVIKRVPFGQIFCLKRNEEYQHLGFILEGGTSEIKDIVANSIAHRSGISRATQFANEYTSRYITEVNNRPLNLYFKNNEAQDRLNAIGKQISILMQPTSFVKSLKKKMKLYKNYKDYIVQ